MLGWRRSDRRLDRGVVFLDRDGVLNRLIEGGYVLDPEALTINEDVVRALAELTSRGVPLVVASNQSCVGRGLLGADRLRTIMALLVRELDARGLRLAAWYCCPHAPGDDCRCRKPRPGLLRSAANDLGIDMTASSFIGDAETDMQAARAAGVRGLLIAPDDAAAVETHVRSILDADLGARTGAQR